MATISTWSVVEFLLAVHKAVDKVGHDDYKLFADADSPTFELLNTYKKCIGEIEEALEEVLLRGLAVDEIRLRNGKEGTWLEELFKETGNIGE